MIFQCREMMMAAHHTAATVIQYFVLSAALFHAAAAWTPPSSPPPFSSSSSSPSRVNNHESSRFAFLRQVFLDATAVLVTIASSPPPEIANAAPPFAIMAEELGYFPVIDERSGSTVLVPAKIKRHSTNQAVALAKYLQSTAATGDGGAAAATMYGAYWCPHCSRQKELFGMEAFKYINYVECDPKGYRSQYATCLENGVDGFPFWKFGNGKSQGGEMELIDIATISGFLDNKKGTKKNEFDASLEFGVPPLGSGASCQ